MKPPPIRRFISWNERHDINDMSTSAFPTMRPEPVPLGTSAPGQPSNQSREGPATPLARRP